MQDYIAWLKAGSNQHGAEGKADGTAFSIRPVNDSDEAFKTFQEVAENAITLLSGSCFVLPHKDSDRSISGYDLVLIEEQSEPR